MAVTYYYATQITNHTFRGSGTLFPAAAFVRPTATYYALFTSPPQADAVLYPGVEVSGANYFRQKCELAASNTNISYNVIDIDFNQAKSDWGLVTHVGIFDNSTIGQGNLLCWDILNNSENILNNKFVKFRAGTLAIRLYG
jgi:hypothetical protein